MGTKTLSPRGRLRHDKAAAMARTMMAIKDEQGCCTEGDLIAAGYRPHEVQSLHPLARQIAMRNSYGHMVPA